MVSKPIYGKRSVCQGIILALGIFFSAVLCGTLLRGLSLVQASQLAMQFESRVIISTLATKADPKFGVTYTTELPWLLQTLSELI
ncbi:hypothetical protein [Lacticaseibacillus manihotivorans]|uniref:hypothetical protein n=1 Tax=Lacticaseibacillus manihotivorans TaxID=88233 RepID=UPI001FB3294E|nr:hypothetical protein [Lacticaseibacillus manihotivorans]